MTGTQPIRAKRAPILLAGLATLGLTLVACGSAASLPQTFPPTVAPTATPIATPTPTPTTTVPAATPVPSAAASQPQTIHLILHAVNDTGGSLPGCSGSGPCQGDFMVGYDPLFDADTGKEVGTFAYECFLVDVASFRYHCPGATMTLTGRGLIVFTELIRARDRRASGGLSDHRRHGGVPRRDGHRHRQGALRRG
ncbi:MAG: hypothetical protein ACHQNA_10875 [Acidimicrobiales bacterium]